ncbi:potassium voltage-gated channel subfamily E member 4 [Melanotaenia boesemani]|uniref:potassium voltage-gated channel subfamily E member 4 n=1 Tax=Melanotaenia boesemani TaxID=1250792 RepID=UPI001C05E656|nr:potassium voltage-gated channel subfamily E member 4 [Melanotaenia boesemani]
MEHLENSTASSKRLIVHNLSPVETLADTGEGNAYFYILIVMCFYGVFLCGIMVGYFRSKTKEKRRINIFTRLLHEEEQREWGAFPKKQSLTFPGAISGLRGVQVTLPFCGYHGNQLGHPHHEGFLPSPLACVLCTEQSSISSLCSSADMRLTIEEESDGGAEGPEENGKGRSVRSGDDSG